MDNVENITNHPWYCLRLFTLKPYEIASFFNQEGVKTFVPEHYEDYEDSNGHVKHALKPVVKNLIFVEIPDDENKLHELVKTDRYKMALMKGCRADDKPAMIPANQMKEFLLMCNPELSSIIVSEDANVMLKNGDPVEVHHGPLKGLTGELVRQTKKYYLLKRVPGMGVLLKVSKWCCKKI